MNGTDSQRRRWWTGAGIGLLIAAAVIAVGIGAYRAGERNADDDGKAVAEVIADADGDGRTIVIDRDGWDRGPGFFPGFLVFPLVVGGIVLLVASRRRRWYGPPYGWQGGPGSGGPGGPPWLDEWHRRAHEGSPSTPSQPGQTTDDE